MVSVSRQHEGCCPISRQPLQELLPHQLYVASDRHAYERRALADAFVVQARRGCQAPTSVLTGAPMLEDVGRLFTHPWPDVRAAVAQASRRLMVQTKWRATAREVALCAPLYVVTVLVRESLGAAATGRLDQVFGPKGGTVFFVLPILATVVGAASTTGADHLAQACVLGFRRSCLALRVWVLLWSLWSNSAQDPRALGGAWSLYLNKVTFAYALVAAHCFQLGAHLGPLPGSTPEELVATFASSYREEAPDAPDPTAASPIGEAAGPEGLPTVPPGRPSAA